MYEIGTSASIGPVAYAHDANQPSRETAKSVTKELSKDNVKLIDELIGKPIDEYIDELLQPSIDEYNERQKRKDRKINSSYSEYHKLNDNKGEMVYSIVFQYGEHETLGKKYYEATDPKEKERLRKEFIDVYSKWLKDWQEQFPSMRIAWAYIHFDEVNGTPHLSTGVIPISSNFKKGPKTQISMSKCLEECGIKRIDTKKDGYQLARAFQQFRKIQERDLKELGYEIKPYKGGKHQDCETYRQLMDEADERIEKAKELESFKDDIQQIEQHEREIIPGKTKEQMIQKVIPSRFGKEECVVISSADFNSLHTVTEIERTKRIVEQTKKKIETEHKKISEKLEIGADESLKQENQTLKYEILERENDIRNLEKKMTEQQTKIQRQETVIKYLLYLIRDEVPKLLERAKDIIRKILNKEEQEQERELIR